MNAGAQLRLTPLRGTEDPAEFIAAVSRGYFGKEDQPRQLLEQTRAFLEANPRPDPWGGYLAWDGKAGVGTCAFKSSPDDTGAVEIAYATFPAYEGSGYAKRMISALVTLAVRSGATCVFANTLPESNASNGALRFEGFSLAGEVEDPDDGLVWRWEKRT